MRLSGPLLHRLETASPLAPLSFAVNTAFAVFLTGLALAASGCGSQATWCNYPCEDLPSRYSHSLVTSDDTLYVINGGGEWIDYVAASGREGVYVGYIGTVGDDYYIYKNNLRFSPGSDEGREVVEILTLDGYLVAAECVDLSNDTYRAGGAWYHILTDSVATGRSYRCDFEA